MRGEKMLKKSYPAVILIVLLGVIILTAIMPFVSGKCLLSSNIYGDTFVFFAGMKYLEHSAGILDSPLWDPYLFCGAPLAGNPQYQLFYPPSLFLRLLPWAAAINWSFLLHFLILGLGMWRLLRYQRLQASACIFAALAMTFSAHMFLRLFAGHLATLNALAWLPWVFLLWQKSFDSGKLRYAFFCGAAWGVQILAGNPQYAYYTFLCLAAYSIFNPFTDYSGKFSTLIGAVKRGSISLLLAGATGICLSAVRVIPAWELYAFSARSSAGAEFASGWFLPFENLITCLVPDALGNIISFPYWGRYNFWEMCVYWGILPLFLSLIACAEYRRKQILFFIVLFVFSLLAALSGQTPFFKLLSLLPGIDRFRGHSKFIVLAGFAVSVLSAYGFERLSRIIEERGKKIRLTLVYLGISAAVFFLFSAAASIFSRRMEGYWAARLFKAAGDAESAVGAYNCFLFALFRPAFLLSALFLLLYLRYKKSINRAIFICGLFVLLLADLFSFGYKYVVCENAANAGWNKTTAAWLKREGGLSNQRVASLSGAYFPNKAILERIQVIDGYDVTAGKRFADYMKICAGQPVDSALAVKIISMAGVKYVLVPPSRELDRSKFVPAGIFPGARLERNLRCLPRAYLVYRAQIAPDSPQGELALLASDSFDPWNSVLLSYSAGLKDVPDQPGEDAQAADILSYSSCRVEIACRLSRQGYLVLSDSFYPGWKATVRDLSSGVSYQADILRANYMFRAINLPPGNYRVIFYYRPLSFILGAGISAVTLLILAGYLFLCARWF